MATQTKNMIPKKIDQKVIDTEVEKLRKRLEDDHIEVKLDKLIERVDVIHNDLYEYMSSIILMLEEQSKIISNMSRQLEEQSKLLNR